MAEKKEKRFMVVSNETPKGNVFASCLVLVDRKTGVNYLMASYGSGTGLTPLLDRDGKPIVTSVYDE